MIQILIKDASDGHIETLRRLVTLRVGGSLKLGAGMGEAIATVNESKEEYVYGACDALGLYNRSVRRWT